MVSDTLKKTIKLLDLIGSIKNTRMRNAILRDLSSNKDIFNSLSEICYNLAYENIRISPQDKKKLKKHKALIVELATKPRVRKKQKELVSQSGGFLPIIIPLVTSIVGELISKAL